MKPSVFPYFPVSISLYTCLVPSSKIRLMRSLVTSIFLYACESWTLTAELQRRIQAMEMRCYRKILRISYKDHVTNEEVRAKIQQAIGPHEDLLTNVKRPKLKWYGHVSDTLHLIQRPCYQRGSPCQDPAGNRTTRRSPDDRKETQTAVVWSCLPFIRSCKKT